MAPVSDVQRLGLGCALAALTVTAGCDFRCGPDARTQVAAKVAMAKGVVLDREGLPATSRAPSQGAEVRELDERDRAADGTPVCAKLCPASGPRDLCFVRRSGDTLDVTCREVCP
jgi:hypothetical protein